MHRTGAIAGNGHVTDHISIFGGSCKIVNEGGLLEFQHPSSKDAFKDKAARLVGVQHGIVR